KSTAHVLCSYNVHNDQALHVILISSFHSSGHLCALHSFPTRRSSDLVGVAELDVIGADAAAAERGVERNPTVLDPNLVPHVIGKDRKSTRLNSSHLVISYAVFCLKKKKI